VCVVKKWWNLHQNTIASLSPIEQTNIILCLFVIVALPRCSSTFNTPPLPKIVMMTEKKKEKGKHHSFEEKCSSLLVVVTLDHGLGATTALAATKAQLDAWLRCTGIRHGSCVASLGLPVGELGVLGCLFSKLLDSGFLQFMSVFVLSSVGKRKYIPRSSLRPGTGYCRPRCKFCSCRTVA
jgi:hypothetical protein